MYNKIALSVLFALWLGFGIWFLTSMPRSEVVIYDCRISEISPDFPPQAREACRKANAQK
jgi:hypothetical protein